MVHLQERREGYGRFSRSYIDMFELSFALRYILNSMSFLLFSFSRLGLCPLSMFSRLDRSKCILVVHFKKRGQSRSRACKDNIYLQMTLRLFILSSRRVFFASDVGPESLYQSSLRLWKTVSIQPLSKHSVIWRITLRIHILVT